MANYNKAVHKLLNIEGFRSDHEADPGGDTAFGIAKNYWPEYWSDGVPDRETAEHFYLHEFWEPLGCDKIHDQRIAYELFEQAVNLGRSRATKFAQMSHNMVSRSQAIAVDGRVGPETLGALNRLSYNDTIRWVKTMNGIQFAYYVYRTGQDEDVEQLFQTTEDDSQQVFFRGWLKRIEFDNA